MGWYFWGSLNGYIVFNMLSAFTYRVVYLPRLLEQRNIFFKKENKFSMCCLPKPSGLFSYKCNM